jgi:hypothetical protein
MSGIGFKCPYVLTDSGLGEMARLSRAGDGAGSIDGYEAAVPLKINHKNININKIKI